jgi:hypothetical protein
VASKCNNASASFGLLILFAITSQWHYSPLKNGSQCEGVYITRGGSGFGKE